MSAREHVSVDRLACVAVLTEHGTIYACQSAEAYGSTDVARVWGRAAAVIEDALGGGWLGSRETGRAIGVAYHGPAEGDEGAPWVQQVHDLAALVLVSELFGYLTGQCGDWHDATDIVGPAYVPASRAA